VVETCLVTKLNDTLNIDNGHWQNRALRIRCSIIINCRRRSKTFEWFHVSYFIFIFIILFYLNNDSRPDISFINDPTIQGVTKRFLDVGESIFDIVQASAVNSRYFKKD
jgi:hypothetical protein